MRETTDFSEKPPYDARAIANNMLDHADEHNIYITNLKLQKLLYFVHGRFMSSTGNPLVRGNFEAWQYGPVHPLVYQGFKECGAERIDCRLGAKDLFTGEESPIKTKINDEARRHIRIVIDQLGPLSPGRLVELSHAPNAPWSYVVNKSRTSVALGLRISNTVISDRFRFHKVAIADQPVTGEPSEDSPLT